MRKRAGGSTMAAMTGLEQGGIRGGDGAWWGSFGSLPAAQMSLDAYAAAVASRELILDETGVKVVAGKMVGDLARAWVLLAEHATRYGVELMPDDLEHTNRVATLDEQILGDAALQERWQSIYAAALAHACGLPKGEDAARSAIEHLERQPSLLFNAFVPLALRRPALTGELRSHALRSVPPPPPEPAPVAAPAAVSSVPAVGSGEHCLNLCDFARLELALQGGDFMTTLYKEGLDPVQYARICDRWARRLEGDAALRAEYEAVMNRTREVSQVVHTAPLPPADTLVLPGQKLARVSDFARISRAAKRGEFREALARAGVDADTFANLCARFNARMQEDAVVAAQFKRLLEDPRID
jgi:hypothetical protein